MSVTARCGVGASPKQLVWLTSLLLGTVLHSSACTVPIEPEGSTSTEDKEEPPKGDGDERNRQDSRGMQTTSETGVGNRAGPGTDSPATGTTTGASSSSQETTTNTAEPAACDEGAEQPCAELWDGTKIVFPSGEPQGSCKRGQSTCVGGQWGRCKGAVGPASKDTCQAGNDDNCNGKPNDHCDCSPGEVKLCGSNVGQCNQGLMTCGSNGKWGDTCLGEVKPTAELCDGMGVDEDCDGAADLEDAKCTCLDGDTRECSVLGELGDCRLGTQSCLDGRFERRCSARFEKATESCGVRRDSWGSASGDEDCDGSIDESDRTTPEPKDCRYYFLDKDGDRFGAKGKNIALNALDATFGCVCDASQVPSSWKMGPKNKANVDCGDDCRKKGGELVFPGTTKYYDEPSECLEKLGSPKPYDYNCDDKQTPSKQAGFRCKREGASCVAAGYWKSVAPVCGAKESYGLPEDCSPEGDGCKISATVRERKVDCQ